MNQNNNYLAEEKVGKLIMKFAIPCTLALLVASLYNIVDQIFIGRGIGYLGNGATNVVFPITVIILAFALMIGDGCAANLSICQGQKDSEGSSKSVGNAIALMVGLAVVFVVILALGRDTILHTFGATDNNYQYAVDYYNIIIIGIPFYFISIGLGPIIRADGDPKFSMIATVLGAIINIILDPIAIFALDWGIKGAALATITGQIISAIVCIYYLRKPISFQLHKSDFVISKKVLSKIVPLGISSFLTQISIVVTLAVMNNMVVTAGAASKYGADIPLTVVGIVFKVLQIVIAFVVGIAAGAQPIVGFNYGAGHYGRVKEIYKKMMIAECVVGAVAMFLVELFPLQIISAFGSESGLYNEYAVLAFRIYLAAILLCAIQKSTSIFLQSLGKPVMAMILSLLRDFVLVVPLLIILANKFGVVAVLYAAPIADVITIVVVVIMAVKVMKELSQKECC